MTAKDHETGKVLYTDQREYFEIGLDLDGYMRYGAWQIKEIVDLTLQPLDTRHERFFATFPKDVTEVDLSVNVYYYISGKKGDLIYQEKRLLSYEEE
ncbi:MAG: hypothetical protein GXO20_03210 [Thermodesulfobacteria bacterium]|nr:hypothetical protein [Thermodesulfobacteriota bacterium]